MSSPEGSGENSFAPSATLPMLRERARLLHVIRQFFLTRGYWEVDTPILSRDGPVDPHLDPFPVAVGQQTYYLQTSPEFGMKRLLAAGADAIVQIGKNFRRGERGRLHNPEFTMIEWYRVGDTYLEQMQLVEELVATVFQAAGRSLANCVRTTYRDAFWRALRIDVATCSAADLCTLAKSHGVPPDIALDDRDGWLNYVLADQIEPTLGVTTLGATAPEFLCDYPASQSALSRIRRDRVTPCGSSAGAGEIEYAVSERFELYLQGVELCNGYTELTDPRELTARVRRESAHRQSAGLPPLPADSALLDAMQHGLPECSGVALGFDRLAMLALGLSSIDAIIPFPIERA